MGKDNTIEYGFYCKNCDGGLVRMIVKSKNGHENVAIKKCTKCSYQYGIKELTHYKKLEPVKTVNCVLCDDGRKECIGICE